MKASDAELARDGIEIASDGIAPNSRR